MRQAYRATKPETTKQGDDAKLLRGITAALKELPSPKEAPSHREEHPREEEVQSFREETPRQEEAKDLAEKLKRPRPSSPPPPWCTAKLLEIPRELPDHREEHPREELPRPREKAPSPRVEEAPSPREEPSSPREEETLKVLNAAELPKLAGGDRLAGGDHQAGGQR